MGSSQSKPSFKDKVKATVEEELAKKMMQQREIQFAVNIAKARDMLQIYGSIYATGVTGVTLAKLAGKPVPAFAAAPVIGGAILLGNMADMAYGNKLQRINKEAEHIMANERPRFVPFKQAPFAKFYTEEEKAALFDQSRAVGELFPSNSFARGFSWSEGK